MHALENPQSFVMYCSRNLLLTTLQTTLLDSVGNRVSEDSSLTEVTSAARDTIRTSLGYGRNYSAELTLSV